MVEVINGADVAVSQNIEAELQMWDFPAKWVLPSDGARALDASR